MDYFLWGVNNNYFIDKVKQNYSFIIIKLKMTDLWNKKLYKKEYIRKILNRNFNSNFLLEKFLREILQNYYSRLLIFHKYSGVVTASLDEFDLNTVDAVDLDTYDDIYYDQIKESCSTKCEYALDAFCTPEMSNILNIFEEVLLEIFGARPTCLQNGIVEVNEQLNGTKSDGMSSVECKIKCKDAFMNFCNKYSNSSRQFIQKRCNDRIYVLNIESHL